jgi:hypothetical protein
MEAPPLFQEHFLIPLFIPRVDFERFEKQRGDKQ